jgi:hypothetical protein
MNGIRFVLFHVFVLVFSLQISAQVLKGEGSIKTDIRQLTGFTEIIAQGRFELKLIQGQQEGIRIESNENLLELFQTRIEGNILYISMTADIRKYDAMIVTVSFKTLEKIYLLSEVSLASHNVIHFDAIDIFSGGMSKINLEIYAAQLSLQLNDGTFANFKGFSESLKAEVHDETEFNAFELEVDRASILSSGLTEVMINVKSDLKLMVSGSSNVYYRGEPTISERIFSSTGFIVKRK